MITDIKVLSRAEMKSIKNKLGVNDLVISINDPAIGRFSVDEGPLFSDYESTGRDDSISKVLTLFFHDLDSECSYFEGQDVLFDDTHATSIAKFIKYWHKRIPQYTLYIHCFAGISRSGACGRVISEYLGINERFEEQHKQIIPNVRVMRMLRPKLGLVYRSR